MRRWLVVMAKAPRAYAVKSRLAGQIGAPEATRFYRATLARLVRTVGADPRWTTILAVTPDMARDGPVWPAGVATIGQGRGDLGCRMQRIMNGLPLGPALIIGSDIPGIQPGHIAEAFASLGRGDLVFGPAEDGGYWLVGMKRRPHVPRIFEGVRWSSPYALKDTLDNCGGLQVGWLPTLFDVDSKEEWLRWRAAVR